MDFIIEKIFKESNLSKEFKESLISLLKEYQDDLYGYISIGEAYELIKYLIKLEKDLNGISLDSDVIKAFIYDYVKRYCVNEKYDSNIEDNVVVWKFMYSNLLRNTIFKSKNRRYFLSLENPECGIVFFIKNLSLKIEELSLLIKNNKNYLVLKKYNEIMNLCHRFGIKNDFNLEKDLEKRFTVYSKFRNPKAFLKEVNKKELSLETEYSPDNFVHFNNLNMESFITLELLHEKMKLFYDKTGYIVRPYSKDIDLYYLKDIIIVAYKKDDVPNMVLAQGKLELNWNDRDFWTKIFDTDMDFVEGDHVNYFNEKTEEMYKVTPLTFKDEFFKNLGVKVIFAPEEYMDEAFYDALTYKDKIALNGKYRSALLSIGFNFNNITNKLLTTDYHFFFKDPVLIDELTLDNFEDYKYLNTIKTKTTSEARKNSIRTMSSYSKKYPKLPPKEEKVYKEMKLYKPEMKWLPYKDN